MSRPCGCKLFKTDSSASADKYHNTRARDRISQLPDNLLHYILRALSIKDAVRTSVLSHRWKHVHSSIYGLNFDPLVMFPSLKFSPWSDYREKFMKAINNLLEVYQCPTINLFKVSVPLGSDFTDDIDGWLGFAMRKGTRAIFLDLCCHEQFEAQPEGKYVLRKEVFDHGGVKINLEYLHVNGCVLGPNFTNHFSSSLQKLFLINSPLVNYDLKSMFSCLLNLKTLVLKRCTLPVNLELGSLTLLIFLCVLDCVGIEDIELPDVKSLQLKGVSHGLVKLKSRTVETIDYWSVTESQLHDIFCHPPQHLPNLEALSVVSKSDWCHQIPKKLAVFSTVVYLTLHFSGKTEFDVWKMVSILKAFPCLRVHQLLMDCPTDVEKSFIRRPPADYVLKCLENVAIYGFHHTRKQIDFANYLLRNARVLKQLIIKLDDKKWLPEKKPSDEKELSRVYHTLKPFDKNRVLMVE